MKVLSIATILSLASVVAGCAMAAEPEQPVDSTTDAFSVVDCNGRPADCDRGEVCLPVGREAYCSSGDRCLDQRDCRGGYVCRANHCLAIQRDRHIDRRTPIRDEADDFHARRRWAAANDRPVRDGDDDRGR